MRQGELPKEVLISPLPSSLPPKIEPFYDPNATAADLRQACCPLLTEGWAAGVDVDGPAARSWQSFVD